MKNILIFLVTVLLIGCETNSDLSINYLEKTIENSLPNSFEYELILLPEKSVVWEDSVFSISQVINGSTGGRITMEKYYVSNLGDSIIIEADLRIPPGAFSGTETISMVVDNQYAAIHFYPEMIFEDTLKLIQKFAGLQLDNYNTGTLDFVFIDDDGTVELIKKNGVQINVSQGSVKVQNAKLTHFSRFGWIRKFNSPILIDTDQ